MNENLDIQLTLTGSWDDSEWMYFDETVANAIRQVLTFPEDERAAVIEAWGNLFAGAIEQNIEETDPSFWERD